MASVRVSKRSGGCSKGDVIEPLIPREKMYRYKPSVITDALHKVLDKVYPVSERTKIEKSMSESKIATCRLVHVMCSSAELDRCGKLKDSNGEWRKEFENALVNALPLREHHRAYLTHSMFVTMVGALVARALEQATRNQAGTAAGADSPGVRDVTLDLLADRHYVRSITCHDSSKTSAVEAAAYSGIMALHIEKEHLEIKRRDKAINPSKNMLIETHANLEPLAGPMADFGFRHHYENNPHHPEHYGKTKMDEMHVVEAVVDGLACVLERVKPADTRAWLDAFYTQRFPNRENKDFADRVILVLRDYITPQDYKALESFRDAVHKIAGESIPWTRVSMTCGYRAHEKPC